MLHIANPVAFVCFFQDAVFAEGANHAVQVAVACPYGIGNIGHDIPEKGVVCGGALNKREFGAGILVAAGIAVSQVSKICRERKEKEEI